MTTYVFRNGKVVEKRLVARRDAPHVISDNMDALRHMADGRHYTSKAKFRQATKDAGCVELGNDSSLTRPRKPIPLSREQRREDIRRTIYELRNGRRP